MPNADILQRDYMFVDGAKYKNETNVLTSDGEACNMLPTHARFNVPGMHSNINCLKQAIDFPVP